MEMLSISSDIQSVTINSEYHFPLNQEKIQEMLYPESFYIVDASARSLISDLNLKETCFLEHNLTEITKTP